MRGARCLSLLLSLLLFTSTSTPAAADPIAVSASPIARFRGASIGQPLGGLLFAGGLDLSSRHPDFGGLSGLAFLDATRFVIVTDQGRFVSGALDLVNGAPAGLSDVGIDVIRNSSGDPLPSRFSNDAEAVEIVFRDGRPAAVRVGFEGLTRLADFDLVSGRPGGPARPVAIPDWLTALRTNASIESVCIAPPASPVAGSTLIVAEGHPAAPGAWAATLLGARDRGDLALAATPGLNPTDCAFLPDGDLLVLERGLGFLSFSVGLRRIPASAVRPGATLSGEVLLSASGSGVDNFEGLGVRTLPDGEVRVTLVSDNNFNGVQRTLLLDFVLP